MPIKKCLTDTCKSLNIYCRGFCKRHYGTWQIKEYRKKHPIYRQRSHKYGAVYKRLASPEVKKIWVQKTKAWRLKLVDDVIGHYSKGLFQCSKCGFSDRRALCLDHVNNDGSEHRKNLGRNTLKGGHTTYVYVDVRRRNYPDGYQVLCCNCNRIKEYERSHAIS